MSAQAECIEKARWLVFKCGPVLVFLALVNSLWIGWSSYYSQSMLVMERNVSVAGSERAFAYTQNLEKELKDSNIFQETENLSNAQPFTYAKNQETQLKDREVLQETKNLSTTAKNQETQLKDREVLQETKSLSTTAKNLETQLKDREVFQETKSLSTTAKNLETQLKDREVFQETKNLSTTSAAPFTYPQDLKTQLGDGNALQQMENISTTRTPRHSNSSQGGKCPAALRHISSHFSSLSRDDIEGLRTVIIFIGFARSGHSIVGSLMDAHPDIIVAHEYNILEKAKTLLSGKRGPLALFNALFKNSHDNAQHGWRNKGRSQKGYTLAMNCTWQGRLRRLRVIGDKSAGKSVQQFMDDHSTCSDFVQAIQATAHAPVKAIRVLRNPYDIVATRLLYTASENRQHKVSDISESHKYHNTEQLARHIRRVFALASHVESMVSECHLPVLDVHLVDLVRRPRRTMRTLCDYVSVECTDDYLEMCEGKVFRTLSKTRGFVEWPQELIENVASGVRNFTAFRRYSFDCDC